MKRSTIVIIIVLALAVLVPVIFVCIVATNFVSDVKEISAADEGLPIDYVVVVDDPAQTHAVNLSFSTERENSGIFSSVNIQSRCGGISTVISSDTIYINIDTLHTNDATPCPIEVVLPNKSSIELHNPSPAVNVMVKDANLDNLQAAVAGDLSIEDSNVGVLLSIDSVAHSSIKMDDSNIGAAKINGQNKTIGIDSSNLGALVVAGDCGSINAADCNIGVATWNNKTQSNFYARDCVFLSNINEDVESVEFDRSYRVVAGDSVVRVKNGEVVNISTEGVHVESGSDKVNITPSKVFVSSGTDTVKVSPAGVHITSGDDKVSIGVDGIKVNKQ